MKISPLLLCLLLAGIYSANGAVAAMTIAQATQFCEAAVPKFCVSTTCPQYCKTIRSSKNRVACLKSCNPKNRCEVKPTVGWDDPKHAALDAQNRDQLWACIAEKRDPDGSKTGRRETPWQQLQSPSFKKAIRA